MRIIPRRKRTKPRPQVTLHVTSDDQATPALREMRDQLAAIAPAEAVLELADHIAYNRAGKPYDKRTGRLIKQTGQDVTMAPEPQRREQRKIHLDASVVPVERALIARADVLDKRHSEGQYIQDLPWDQVASEFRALAEELHFW